MNETRVIVVVLNWNGKADTLECLESLKRVHYPGHKIVVVDNGSTDDSVEAIRSLYPDTEIFVNQTNLGYAGGNNVGLRRAIALGVPYFLVLNNDTVVDPDFLRELFDVAESDKTIGVVGPAVYDYGIKDRIQELGGKILWKSGQVIPVPTYDAISGSFPKYIEVDTVCGCCFLGRVELLEKVGFLDEDFFSHWEEYDWHTRVKRNGYRVVYAGNARIWHKAGQSSRKLTGFKDYYNARNRVLFMKKNASRGQLLLFLVYLFGFNFWTIGFGLAVHRRNPTAFLSFLKGTASGVAALLVSR